MKCMKKGSFTLWAIILLLSIASPAFAQNVAILGGDQTVDQGVEQTFEGFFDTAQFGENCVYYWKIIYPFYLLERGSGPLLPFNYTFENEGAYKVLLMVNVNGMSIGSDMVNVTVKKPERGFKHVLDAVKNLIGAKGKKITHGNLNSLCKKLQKAIYAYELGDTDDVIEHLEAFVNQINAFVNARKISSEVGYSIIDQIEAFLANY